MENNDDFILDMLDAADRDSTDISGAGDPEKLELKRDEKGILWSYNKETGEKVGRIYEHGNDGHNVSKTFNDICKERR